MTSILMPKATAIWLLDNSSLTFEQIADFCGLHHLEVASMADGHAAGGMLGSDPVAHGQLTREELEKGQKDPGYRLKPAQSKHADLYVHKRKGARYTPLSRRQDRPNAIAWLVRYHPEMSDGQISRLIGTTKPTIESIRNRTHWNSSNIKPHDPVSLHLCTQAELDEAVAKALKRTPPREEEGSLKDEGPRLDMFKAFETHESQEGSS